MLEVKDLVKVYKTKGGAEVRALDGVTLSFEEKGMVFLLGRSGSGKSTLLNVCGGLDSPDSGEIIVKGKSSKDFSASDFDSYRNTYVGFIFQEYNILNEFSVEDNIALALELQGKPKDKQEIAKLLEQVDLTDFAKRKPNTLSGGQKQRVAIARALVKNPEIIMADEPTGALDSNTGKQVLDTLKRLSQDKLVIVVSHDREFAEEYGDRIIELMDGKVISDVVKSSITAKKESENVSLLEGNTLLIKSGTKLTDKDIAKINKIISSSKEDILVSANKEDISLFKKSAKINDDNSKECFVELQEQPKAEETQEKGKFIKSKLKFKHAVKIGASGIKTKPFRFMLTLFLSTVAFIMFGLLSCLMYYDGTKTAISSLCESRVQYLKVSKQFAVTEVYKSGDVDRVTTELYNTFISDDDCAKAGEELGEKYIKVYNIEKSGIENLLPSNLYYSFNNIGFVESCDNLRYVDGGAPEGNGEIAIPEYLYEAIKDGTLYDPETDAVIKVSSYEDIVLKLRVGSQGDYIQEVLVKVSGVFESEEIPEKFDKLKEKNDSALLSDMETFMDEGFVLYFAIDAQAYDAFAFTIGLVDYSDEVELCSYGESLVGDFSYIYSMDFGRRISSMSDLEHYYDFYGERKELEDGAENKIVLNMRGAEKYVNFVSFVMANLDKLYPQYSDAVDKFYNEHTQYNGMTCKQMLLVLLDGSPEEAYEKIGIISEFLATNIPDIFERMRVCNLKIGDNEQSFKSNTEIIGFNLTEDDYNGYFSEDIYRDYEEYSRETYFFRKTDSIYDVEKGLQGKYASLFVNTNNADYDAISKIVKNTGVYAEDDSVFIMINSLKSSVDGYTSTVDVLSQVFLWTGLVVAVFAILLLFNFISASITAKKKEIGILRAVGARGADVFKIFFVEAAIIVIACVILSILVTGIMSVYINDTVAEQLNVNFVMFSFGIESILTIIAIAVVTAFVSTFIPVYTYAKKKPVESIRAL